MLEAPREIDELRKDEKAHEAQDVDALRRAGATVASAKKNAPETATGVAASTEIKDLAPDDASDDEELPDADDGKGPPKLARTGRTAADVVRGTPATSG